MIVISHEAHPYQKRNNLLRIADKVRNYQPGIMGEQISRKYSIMIPIIKKENDKLAILFEERAHTLRSQAGEICFPGGRWETGDATYWDTARRETSEELQIPQKSIEYLGSLDTLFSHSQLTIYTFVGLITEPKAITPSPSEVASVFTIDVDHLLTMEPERYDVPLKPILPENYPLDRIPDGENYRWRESTISHYFYQYGDITIWGLTARILNHFVEIIRE